MPVNATARRLPFRSELPVSDIVRRHISNGTTAPQFASALFDEASRLLCEAAGNSAQQGKYPRFGDLSQLAANALALYNVSLSENAQDAVTPEWLEELHRLSKPDADHKRHGRWYTPRPIARYMAQRALATAAQHRPMETAVILDPACGCGALLVPMFEELVAYQLQRRGSQDIGEVVGDCLNAIVAADVDQGALEITVQRLRWAAQRIAGTPVSGTPRTFCGNSLTAPARTLVPEGADVVVMNPPYLGNRYFAALKNPEKARADLKKQFGWNDDLYTHFLHKAWDWLRPGGCLCAITSDTFLTIPSKARTRQTLRAHSLCEIVRVPASAFAASVNTCITLAVRAQPGLYDTLDYIDAREAPEQSWTNLHTRPSQGVQHYTVPAQIYAEPEYPFYLPTPRAVELFQRFFAGRNNPTDAFVRLGEVAPAMDCGINSGNVRHHLFFLEPRPGLNRLIQGRQLERYIVRWNSPAAKFRWVDINYVPDTNAPGIGRGGKTSPRTENWGFRGEMLRHKAPVRLFLRQTEDDLFAAMLEQEPDDPTYTDNTLFTLLLTERGRELGLTYLYLLGLLNSAFLNELYHLLSQEEGRAQAQVKVGFVNRLPVAVPTAEQRAGIEGWVEQAIAAQASGKPMTAIQWQLDTLVAKLYGVGDRRGDKGTP